MNNPIIELKNVTKSFNQGEVKLEILKEVSMSINQGEMVALVGPSGAGKSTLLQVTGLLDSIDNGEILFKGKDLTKADEAERTLIRRKELGFVYQYHHLLPEFTAVENVSMPLLISGVTRAEAQEKALELLESLGLKERAHHLPAELSGGEQQRVAIARALVHSPSLLLADEPTGNLDPDTAGVVFDILINLVKERNLAAFIVTHNPDLAKKMDRIVTIKQGNLVEIK
jgi:lipoprotein-releasing system ATP-binding protein